MKDSLGGIFAIVYLVYQQVENELLQPLIQRRALKMSPLIITLVMRKRPVQPRGPGAAGRGTLGA